MDSVTDLRYAIDWYLESIPPSSRFPPAPPANPAAAESALAEIEEAIVPLRLPAEVVWMWRTWEANRFSPLPYPSLTDPLFALDSWSMNVLESGDPKILFPIAYQSHGFLLAELGGPPDVAAPIWKYAYTDEHYVLAYPSLASLFRACAETAELSGVQPPADDNDRHETYANLLGGPTFTAIVERQMSMSPHAERDRQVPVGDVRRWPKRWQEAQGVSDESVNPLGATHTIRAFATEASHGPVTGRVVGRFRAQGGGGIGPGGSAASFGLFSDGTDSIQVVLPDSVLDLGGRGGDVDVEVELETGGPVNVQSIPGTRAIQDAALQGDMSAASDAAIEWAHALQDASVRMPVIRRMVPIA